MIVLLFSTLFCCGALQAQEAEKSQQQPAAATTQQVARSPRSQLIKSFRDNAGKGNIKEAVADGIKATSMYYKDNLYQEAFDLLREVDQTISNSRVDAPVKSALRYQATKERMQMYMRLRKNESAKTQLAILESHANQSGNDSIKNDLLYNKAIFFYTFGQQTEGNAVFKEMADKLTAQKEYDKVDEVYQTLIATGRRSGNASLLAQSYSSYMAWKDSTNALKRADEVKALKQQIADGEAIIADKDSSLSLRMGTIIALCVLAAALAVALVLGAIVLMRYIVLTRKQKNTIQLANDSNALKAKFISNISAQLEPTLKKLDKNIPEVKAMLEFSSHVQTLSELENRDAKTIEYEEVQVATFCDEIIDKIRGKVKNGVNLAVNAPKMTATFNLEYVTHILLHLLRNAAEYTPADGNIWLDFKKRGPHTYQFLVSNTGEHIPEEKHEDIFKPFLEIKDLTKGDGLGLPTCKQMALKMNGDLEIDKQFTKGTRFVLNLHS